jgi:hypothetical protein
MRKTATLLEVLGRDENNITLGFRSRKFLICRRYRIWVRFKLPGGS